MELKTYQKQVIADLSRYLELLNKTKNISAAYKQFWHEKGVNVGFNGIPSYQNTLPGVPSICLKVPTGGGKTYLAANAIHPIFEALPNTKTKVVVWLVPSDAILTQTLEALRDPSHPYRQKLDTDYSSRVVIYSKEQLLFGQGFNPTAVTEQLSVMVLSYDSFRGRKESLKARQENSNLAEFAKVLGTPENPVDGADETALIQIINQLSPLVIVDESHHAKSKLSMDMLRDFNPCFLLELTATPRKESNILCYVDAMQLKRESMVKLPVVVYNRFDQAQVLADAIDLRNKLEELADQQRLVTGRYIRPIVLFQAQPRNKENSTTFEKLRDKLVEIGIPSEQIAIRTADVNELKSVDLMSESCPIRYIITVNALKEGWDCPFAYILASLANKTSQVDVEQILGRILRLPHTKQNRLPSLNMSYVLTSSNDFNATLQGIVRGLNSAGFSDKDCRLAAEPEPVQPSEPAPVQLPIEPEAQDGAKGAEEDFLDFNSSDVAQTLEDRQKDEGGTRSADDMLAAAEQTGQEYESALQQQEDDPFMQSVSWEVRDKVPTFTVMPEFEEEIKALRIPQFFYNVPESLFSDGSFELLEKEILSDGFTLKGKSTEIDFASADTEMVMVDVRDQDGSMPKVFKMSNADQQYFKEYFSKLPAQKKLETCKGILHQYLNKLNLVDSGELKQYINRVVEDMTDEQLSALEKSPIAFAAKIKSKIETLLNDHYVKTFYNWLETGTISCREHYQMPLSIHPLKSTSMIGGSLYAAEEEMNGLERDLIMNLTAIPSVRWWHRNIARHEFRINGFINHYPDVMIMTEKGHIIFAETKGEHLKNPDTQQKLKLGRTWQQKAGEKYRYYMVFRETDTEAEGAVSMSHFLEILKQL